MLDGGSGQVSVDYDIIRIQYEDHLLYKLTTLISRLSGAEWRVIFQAESVSSGATMT